ncbi:MAG: acetyl-CoA carboxylase biotin carboxyl carrier protein [bacterium]
MKELAEIKKFFKLMVQEHLYELNIEKENFKLAIKRKTKSDLIVTAHHVSAVSNTATHFDEAQAQADIPSNYTKIESPINGVFYRAPSPEAASFVDVGSVVSKGNTLCIVEAMKLMNEIQAEKNCKIISITAGTGSSVTAGQTLFIVEEV